MSTMNPNKRNHGNRGGRMGSGGRPDKRQTYNTQDRQPRARGGEKNINVNMDGTFKNQRFTHVIFSLVGSVVQIQVKNGIVYEGILKTISPKSDAVLEMAHMVEDNTAGNHMSVPSRERLIDKLIIKAGDVVTLCAGNVDLDYAVKDSFTDSSISKYNGENKEKEFKELQPWDAEGLDDTGGLEGDRSSNGWDANDMFRTNATQFNVQSSYDDSLAQYTTKLEKGNSDEYRRREEQACRLAAEIEGSEQYKKHIALENGEGEGDEESRFSSVVRPGDGNNPQMPNSGGPGKYIPPNKRNAGAPGVSKPRSVGHNPAQPPPSHPAQGPQPPPGLTRNNSIGNHAPTQSAPKNPQLSVDVNGVDESARSNIPASTAGPTIKTSTSSPVHEQPPVSHVDNNNKDEHNNTQHQTGSKMEGKKKGPRDERMIKELREFSSNFKLDKSSIGDTNRDTSISDDKDSSSLEKGVVDEPVLNKSADSDSAVSDRTKENLSPREPVVEKPKESPALHSNLNPNAKEFSPNPLAKPFVPHTSQQVPTPPRPQTQSPIIQQVPPTPVMNIPPTPVYPTHGQPYIMNPAMVLNNQAAPHQPMPSFRPKRAVVSVNTQSAVQTATGQPLIAQSAQPYIQYLPQMLPPQPTGYGGQMMPMPAPPSGQRFMTPTSMPTMPPTSIQGLEQPSHNAAQANQVFMAGVTPPQPNQMSHNMSHPSHMNHHNVGPFTMPNQQMPQQQQGSQISAPPPPSGGGGGGGGGGSSHQHHPAPSPVHTNTNQQQPLNSSGPHPPSSGTPQPPQTYPQGGSLQGHPPLQPSPHNHTPTSPQNSMHAHPMPYQYQSHGHHLAMQQAQQQQQQQQGVPNSQQFSGMTPHSNVPTSGSYNNMQGHHHHHSPLQQPYMVLQPHAASTAGQMNPHPHVHSQHQFQGQFPGPNAMQQQILSSQQAAAAAAMQQAQNHGQQTPHTPHQMPHFMQPVHNPPGGPQSYQPSQ